MNKYSGAFCISCFSKLLWGLWSIAPLLCASMQTLIIISCNVLVNAVKDKCLYVLKLGCVSYLLLAASNILTCILVSWFDLSWENSGKHDLSESSICATLFYILLYDYSIISNSYTFLLINWINLILYFTPRKRMQYKTECTCVDTFTL